MIFDLPVQRWKVGQSLPNALSLAIPEIDFRADS
jgi:hypothetical protein